MPKEEKLRLLEEVVAHEEYMNKPMGAHRTIDKKDLYTIKRIKLGIGVNHHDISPEFKELGYLSAHGRQVPYEVQDGAIDFCSMPTIFR